MTPIAFGGCFGWLHAGTVMPAGDVAILLCPALNRAALDAHHAQRVLPDRFAEAGYPAMRFDYPGTADSADITSADGRTSEIWAAWQRSVNDAADFLRGCTGARRIILCGLRIGATLAALTAAARDDVAGLILLEPVLKGQSYLRQLWIEAQLQRGAVRPIADGLDFQEIHLTSDTTKLIGAVDLRRIEFPAGLQIAIFAQAQTKLLDDCAVQWMRQCAVVSRHGFDGLAPLLHHNLEDDKPAADFTSILGWVRHAVPIQPVEGRHISVPERAIVLLSGCIETPLQFGPDNRLFGILCRPKQRHGNTVVIIANTGRDPRHSPARLSVNLARYLARKNIASLRFDFSGLGDSLGPPGREDLMSPLFDMDRSGDLRAAVDLLEKMGFQHFNAYGLCAGAYHALQGALADSRITSLFLVNLPLFIWKQGKRMEFARHNTRPLRYFLKELSRVRSLRELIDKRRQVSSVLKAQSVRFVESITNARWLRRSGTGANRPAHQLMNRLSYRRVKTFFLFSGGDVGLDAIPQEFDCGAEELTAFAGVTMHVEPEFDHMLSTDQMQVQAFSRILDFIQPEQCARDGIPAQLEYV